MMKKLLLVIIILCMPASILARTPTTATGGHDVAFTPHNMAYNTNLALGITNGGNMRNYRAANSGANQICVFCHTPHNATRNAPLWNRNADPGAQYGAGGYALYTSSSTLSNAAKTATLTAKNESILCLSCHDGKTAINVLHSSGYRDPTDPGTGDVTLQIFGFAPGAVNLGQNLFTGMAGVDVIGATRDSSGKIVDGQAGYNLTDDHPIGFSYTAAVGSKTTQYVGLATIKSTNPAIRFFGPNQDRLECSTCHDPHVYYGYLKNATGRVTIDSVTGGSLTSTAAQKELTPFLVQSNTGSGLCLSCHIK
ncbi:MAG TPA: hypothetical protein HPP76_08010 [Desulfuromonadales bacterium]|nr:hypothetical protein [Desulfuromonadales bacterium]